MLTGNPTAAKPGDPASNSDISVMSPIFLWGDAADSGDKLRALLGTPGSFGIPQTTTQLILNVLDFGMDMQAAIEAPRVRLPETNPGMAPQSELGVVAEKRISAKVLAVRLRLHLLHKTATLLALLSSRPPRTNITIAATFWSVLVFAARG